MRTTMAALALAALGSTAGAADYSVQASGNSTNGGTGLPTIPLMAGQEYTVSVAPGDLWSAGALPRWSDANGLVGNLYATGMDDSGQPSGTLIGVDFGLLNQHGFTAPYGALVGNISGVWVLLGTHYTGTAPLDGTLYLFYWDANFEDNTDAVLATVEAAPLVPEPATWAMLGAGLVLLTGRRLMRTGRAPR